MRFLSGGTSTAAPPPVIHINSTSYTMPRGTSPKPSSSLLPALFVLVAILSSLQVVVAASPDSCNANVDIPKLGFVASSLACNNVWSAHNFNLRYFFNSSSDILSILLSADAANNWIALGFSPDGNMVGSSAMVGYLEGNGTGAMRQYYLAGQQSELVLPDQGNLSLIKGSDLVVLQNQTTYMAFQIHIDQSSANSSKLVLALGIPGQLPDPQTNHIQEHQDRYSTVFDFSTGVASSTTSSTDNLRRTHGIVNIIGWAALAPIGVIIARYFRQWDPAWFYLHLGFQISSLVFGVTGFALGLKLVKRLPDVAVHRHRLIGTFVLVLGILQIFAVCTRPHKEAKIRKYWNWYHHILGRLVLLLAAVNIVVGMNLADAGRSMRVGYYFLLVVTILCALILELVLWYKWFKQPPGPIPPRTPFSAYNNL